MWSKLPASRWCLTTVCSVAELYSLWTHIWKNPIWVSHTAEAWRANKRLSALWENMLILQARHSSSCSSPRLIPPGFLTWLLLHLVHTFDSFLQLCALSNRYKKSCFEAGLSAVLCVRPPKKRDHNGVLKPSQSRARCFERKVGSCLSAKSPGGGFGSIKKTSRSHKKGPERSEGTINYMRNRRRERVGGNNVLHNSCNSKNNMTNRKKSLII